MDEELNDLTTDNTATTFSADTDNTATSDELNAPEVYDTGKRTGYAIAKGAIIASGVLATAALGASFLQNFTKSKPFINVDEIVCVVETQSLHYRFSTLDASGYQVYFTVTTETQTKPLLDLDVTEVKTYEGSLALPEPGKGIWRFVYAESEEGERTTLRSQEFTLELKKGESL